MKYIDADRLKAEIERRKGYISVTHFAEELLSFIDSLPAEKPSEDLEEVAENIYKVPFGTRAEDFIAGAVWQKRQILKEAVEGRVFMSFAPGHNQMVMADVNLPTNTKVRIVVLKAEEE